MCGAFPVHLAQGLDLHFSVEKNDFTEKLTKFSEIVLLNGVVLCVSATPTYCRSRAVESSLTVTLHRVHNYTKLPPKKYHLEIRFDEDDWVEETDCDTCTFSVPRFAEKTSGFKIRVTITESN